MQYIKAKFLKQDKPSGRAYTYRTEDDLKPSDIVTDAKGSKLVVVDESVDMAWVETYGADKVAVAKKYVESMDTYDPLKANAAQEKYCMENGYPHFAPSHHCYRCHQDIYLKGKRRDGKEINGISVEKAGNTLITGCPYCNWSYCE